MQYFKFLLFFVIFATSESLPPLPIKTAVSEWDNNKLEILTDMVETLLQATGNAITIVASQNVHNADGSFKEIKTIELTVPNMFHWSSDSKNMYADYIEKLKQNHDELGDTIQKMQKDFKHAFVNGHYEKEAAYQKLTDDGETEFEMYVSKDEVFYYDDEGMGYYVRDNIYGDDKKKMEEEFKKRFEDRKDTLLSVLVWDKDDKFVSKESMVEPSLMVYVDKASDNADEKTMDSAMEGLSKYILNNPDRVAKELSAAMSNDHPKYTWFVTKGQDEQADMAKHDVYVKLTYDNVDWDEMPFEYTVYGVMK